MKITTASNILAALALSTAASHVHADEATDKSGWYAGFGVGQSLATIEDARIANSLAAQGFAQTQIEKDTRDLGFKLLGGYQFGRYFALEGGYFDLGQFDFTATTQPPGTLRGEAQYRGVNLDAVGILPLTERFSAFGRAGAHYTESKAAFQGTGAVGVTDPNRKEKGINYKVGAGLEYALTPQLGLRAELERYRVDDAVGNDGDVDLASLGLVYRFKSQPVVAYTQPEPVAAAAPPSAPPLPPVPPLIKRSLTLSADSQFDFNRASIKPEGRQALDRFAGEIKGSEYDVITVRGHTDRLGSAAYNDALSLQRAETVKNYLVETAQIPSGKIDAKGLGESAPRTRPGDCAEPAGAAASAGLIRCLQLDRRVEVQAVIHK